MVEAYFEIFTTMIGLYWFYNQNANLYVVSVGSSYESNPITYAGLYHIYHDMVK